MRRLGWSLILLMLGVVMAVGAEQTEAGLQSDLVQLMSHVPEVVISAGVLAVQVAFLMLALAIPCTLMATRRWRHFWIGTIAVVGTPLALNSINALLPASAPVPLPDYGLPASTWPPSTSVAGSAALFAALSPYLSRRWIRFGWVFMVSLVLSRLIAAAEVARDLVLAIGVGASVGFLLLIVFGRALRVATPATVRYALERAGLQVESVDDAAISSATSTGYAARLNDGTQLHGKVVGGNSHEAETMVRVYRRLRLKDVGEDAGFTTVRQAATAEAMMSLLADERGVQTPTLRIVAPVSEEEMVLAFEHVDGQTLDSLPDAELTDEALQHMWRQVVGLRSAGIAHRDLNLASWMKDRNGEIWLIDFSLGEAAASDGALASDIAELLAATYARVGAERAVAAASAVLSTDVLATGLPRLVPAALTKGTRAKVKSVDGKLGPLTAELCRVTGAEETVYADLERVKPKTLLMGALMVVAVYVLLPQFADLPRMVESIADADLKYAAYAALASLLTYIGSGLAIAGSAPGRVPLGWSWLASVAATFVGAVAPPGVGHMGLNVRFLQKQGLPAPVAVSATAVKEVGVGAVHVSLLILLGIIAGTSGALEEELNKLPSAGVMALIVLGLVVLGVGAMLTPPVRRLMRDTVLPALKQSWSSLAEIASSPGKIVMLIGGGLLLQLGYIGALYFAVHALGGDTGFATIGLLYLTVGSAASVAPTPGGVGAVEAVLLAALTGVGLASSVALAAVFLYRLVTFWVPIPFGGLSFRFMVAKDAL